MAQYPKNKRPNQKMGRRPKQTFLQRRHTDGQKAHEKTLNITERNANQNYHERGFPGGAVVKNPPANAGDTRSIPGPGRSHMLWSN